MSTIPSDSPTPSDSFPPADPAQAQEWLDEQIDALAAMLESALVSILRDAVAQLDVTTVEAPGPLVAAAGDALDGVARQWQDFAKELSPYFGGMFDSGALAAWLAANPLDPNVIENWPGVINEEAERWAREASNRVAKMGPDLQAALTKRLTQAIEQGEGVRGLADWLEDVKGLAKSTAQTIARTEVVAAYNNGDQTGAQALGDEGPAFKSWLATMDHRTRPTHVAADGQTVPFTKPFIVGGYPMMHPHDHRAPGQEWYNCRCTTLHYYPGDTLPDGREVPEPVSTKLTIKP